MKRILLLLSCIFIFSCGSSRLNNSNDSNYGYVETEPILVGGEDLREGPRYERDYLNKLSGPNGEEISFTRLGSCCMFETENGMLGGGMLDKYEITYDGLKKPIILYLNMYDPDPNPPKAPRGLKFRN